MMVRVFYRSVRAGAKYVNAAGGPEHYGGQYALQRMLQVEPDRHAWLRARMGKPLLWHVDVDRNPPPCDRVIKPEMGDDIIMRAHIVFADPALAVLYRLTWA